MTNLGENNQELLELYRRKYGENLRQRGFELIGAYNDGKDLMVKDLETGIESVMLGPGRVIPPDDKK